MSNDAQEGCARYHFNLSRWAAHIEVVINSQLTDIYTVRIMTSYAESSASHISQYEMNHLDFLHNRHKMLLLNIPSKDDKFED